MFLFKLKNNNKGYSSLTWTTILFMTIVAICAILDIVNLTMVRTTLINRVDVLANIATVQGGFNNGAPTDWGQVMNQRYITRGECESYFTQGFSRFSSIATNARVDLPGAVDFNKQGVVTGYVTYCPIFSRRVTSGISSGYNMSHRASFSGFWIYKTEYM